MTEIGKRDGNKIVWAGATDDTAVTLTKNQLMIGGVIVSLAGIAILMYFLGKKKGGEKEDAEANDNGGVQDEEEDEEDEEVAIR